MEKMFANSKLDGFESMSQEEISKILDEEDGITLSEEDLVEDSDKDFSDEDILSDLGEDDLFEGLDD